MLSKVIKIFVFLVMLVELSGCVKPEVDVQFPGIRKNLNLSISNVQVINNQLIITGSGFNSVENIKIKDGTTETSLAIHSKSSTTLVAQGQSHLTLAAGKILNLIFSNAKAQAAFAVNFSLCDATLGNKAINCSLVPNDKEVLSFDASTQTWKPRAVNGLSYLGAWDASGGLPPTLQPSGAYYVISNAGTISGVNFDVGDWIVSNGTIYQKINNASGVSSVFGRSGAVVAQEGDYDLSKLSDVTINAPALNQVLRFNGTTWVNATLSFTESDPTVQAFAKSALPSCGAGQVLKSNGTDFSCVTDVSGGSSFTGTPNTVVMTDGAGALTSSSITTTIFNHLSNVTSDIQTQLNAKLNSGTFVDWSTNGVQTIDPTRLNLTTADRVVITNGTSTPIASSITSTQLGYLSGVTSNIQTQLNSKISSETDPSVSAFAKSTLPTCNAGEVLKADGTTLSCITDNAGAGAYGGGNNLVVVTNGTGNLSDSTVTTTELGYLSGVSSNIQTQLNAKQGILDKSSVQDLSKLRIYGANTTNFVEFTANTLTDNRLLIFPDSNGANGNVLSTDGAGNLSWIAIPSAPVTSVNGSTGVVILTTSEISEGTNLYFTDARARSAAVADSIGDGITTLAPSQNAVFDALSLKLNSGSFIQWDQSGVQTIDPSRLNLGAPSASKALTTNGSGFIVASSVTSTELGYLSGVTSNIQTQFNNILGKALTGLSTATNAVITEVDSVLVALGKLQAQISDLNSRTLKTDDVIVGNQAASKAYVDGYWSDGSIQMIKNAAAPVVCDAATDAALAVTNNYTTCICKNGTGWVSTTDGITTCGWTGASLGLTVSTGNATAMDVVGAVQGTEAFGSNVTFTLTNTGGAVSATVFFALSNTTNFAFNGGTCTSGSTTLAPSATCTIIVRPKDTLNESFSGNLNITANNNPTIAMSGTASGFNPDPCSGSPAPGTVCAGGAIYLGSLSPGATSGSGTNKYMTTPGNCGEIPAGQIVGSGASAYPNADFTPTCNGATDSLTKYWNDGTSNWYDIPGLTNYTTTAGTGSGATNTDQFYGSANTANIVAITLAGQGGYHAAARYCDRLNYGGYTDWHLPNRYELNLMWTNKASIPGLDISGNWYWSSTEYDNASAWIQRFSDGNQGGNNKNNYYRIRCVRRY